MKERQFHSNLSLHPWTGYPYLITLMKVVFQVQLAKKSARN